MKTITIYIMVLLFVILGICEAKTQEKSDLEKVLNTAFINSAVKFKLEKTSQLGSLDYNVPLIEKIEIRSETNDFNIKEQDLAIRVSPNTSSSRKAHRLYHESVQYMTEMEYASEIMKALSERYQLIKDYVITNEMLRLEKIKNLVALDKVKLLRKMISLTSFDIVELIEAEDEIYKLQRKIQSLKNTVENLNLQLCNLLSTDEINIEKEDIISVQEIKSLLDLKIIANCKNHPVEEVLSAKHYNTLMEYEWEASKSKFSIGFIQAKFGYDTNKSFGNNFSLGFGFDFPMKGSSRLDLNEIRVNILDAQSKYLETKDQIDRNQQVSKSRLISLISMYELLSIQIEEGNANHALIEYSKQGVASPRAILKLKELTVSNEALLIELQSEITTTYLEYIYNSGAIGTKPYKNYFNENLTALN